MSVRRGVRRFGIAAFAVLLPIAAWSLWDYVEGVRLARAIRIMHARGDPISDAELASSERPTTEEQTRASRYYLAAAVLASGLYENGKPAANAPDRFADALVMLDRATPLDFRGLQPGTDSSYRTAFFLYLARLNSLRTESRARAGDGDGAAASLVASLRLRRVMERLTPWTWALDDNFLPLVGATLNQSRPSSDMLGRVQSAIESATRASTVEDGLAAMRAQVTQMFWTEYFGGSVVGAVRGVPRRLPLGERAMRPWRTHRFITTLRAAERLLETARQPWPRKLDAFPRRTGDAQVGLATRPPRAAAGNVPRWWLDLPLVDGDVSRTVERAAFRLAADRVAIAAAAAERFRRAHGDATPASLSELAPDYLTSIPDDPFSGKPLFYRRDADGYVVYSAGPNRTDDGGKVGDEGSDVGLRISARQR
jgi:hypothetical protein